MTRLKHKILLAEDDKFLVIALKDKLEREGFSVVTVNDGNEVLPQIKKEKPEIVLLDVMMPGKNGFDIIEEIKSEEKFKKVPVIIISNLGQESDIKKGIDFGANDYIVKSDLSISGITKKVKKYLTDFPKK